MGVLRQITGRSARALVARCVAVLLALSVAGYAHGSGAAPDSARVWNAALVTRSVFEAEPPGTHTRASYDHVMDSFRAIYHSDPADPYAARAAAQVAELLAEQGRELHDRKSLQDAAGQYEFVARAYPASSVARDAKTKAAALLQGEDGNATVAVEPAPPKADLPRPVVSSPVDARNSEPSRSEASSGAGMATVSAIRHWSTPTYTRVAIDLGDEVRFEAARVENPDRIFFDLHHARLAPSLSGKSFAVTDEGFLTRIRAAQFSGDVTRVVLDVHEVAEYSAFLLPNPYRLIIDIHGKPPAGDAKGTGEITPPASTRPGTSDALPSQTAALPQTERRAAVASPEAKSDEAKGAQGDHYVPRRLRGQATKPAETASSTPETTPEKQSDPNPGAPNSSANAAAVRSNLPPTPVTDGSAAFGLPTRGSGETSASASVAGPRVVIPSRPTVARPVPNTVATRSNAANREVAAVSDQPGKVEATARPTSQPVADTGTRVASNRDTASTSGSTPRARKGRGVKNADTAASPALAAPPTAEGETSLLRALGLKIGRIVIDAGHGGHDSGTLGVDGLEEKDVVLDVALRLGKLLHERLGAEIVYTRADDTFIPLETRTAIANKAQADLFISVHANSSADPTARGVEVYYLNFTSDPEAMQVASRENAVSTKSVHELSDLVRRIALKDKIEESHELAADVDSSLFAGLAKGNSGSNGLKDRGVKKAPFVVLIGANMPSILAEISFVTNPKDAAELDRPEYRQRVAESLYAGVAHYASNINGRRPSAEIQRAEKE